MIRPGSSFSKPVGFKPPASTGGAKPISVKIPTLQEFVKSKDWNGAIAFLEFQRSLNTNVENSEWLAYCCFHGGDYRKSIQIYDELIRKTENKEYFVYKACCFYALCQFDDSKREALKGPESPLQTRLLFHIAHKKNDQKNLMIYHAKLQESIEDQLCLASLHYLRGHYEEANEIYKKPLLESREYHAISVYMALCYYKQEFYDVSLEVLQQEYLAKYPESIYATNLKACNNYELYTGKNAEEMLKPLQQSFKGTNIFEESDLLRHNLVVFRDGENAIEALPKVMQVFPEAKLNLVIYHLKNDEINQAFNLIKDLEANIPKQYILKGVVYAMYGQQNDSKDHIKTAQQLFQLVGASSTQCDTIPGRQCMASCFFLLKQFDDVLIYLKSIKSYFQTDDDFNWNYGLACAQSGDFKQAEETLLMIRNERYKNEEIYLRWLIRIYIMNSKPGIAWKIYIEMETSVDSFTLLQLIANDCYQMGHFYYSAKAFEALVKLERDEPAYSEGLRGAVVGTFQMVIAGKETGDHLVEALSILKSAEGNKKETDLVFKVINKWAKENGFDLEELGL